MRPLSKTLPPIANLAEVWVAPAWCVRVVASPDSEQVNELCLVERTVGIGRDPAGDTALVLRDSRISRLHATLTRTKNDELVVCDEASQNGVHVNGTRVEQQALRAGDLIRIGDSMLLVGRGAPAAAVPEEDEALGIVSRAPSLRALRAIIRRVGPSRLPVLITGPTGTGKELVARALHTESGRRGHFVALNCAALPGTLVENALFGHKRGAYTDANSDQDGAFVRADGGTLFLDEIGDLAAEAQPKLLRVLESADVTPVGATVPVSVDLRIVVATHVALDAAVKEGRFREDLYARLAGVTLKTPPLAEHKEDVLLLLERFLPEPYRQRPMSPDFVEGLLAYDWPRNVRELAMLAERLQVLYPDAPRFELGMLDEEIAAPLRARHPASAAATAAPHPPSRDELVALLARCGGNVSRVARLVQRNRKQVYRWMDIYGVARGAGRAAALTRRSRA